MKRTVLIGFLVAALLVAGCGQQGSGESAQGGSGSEKSCDVKNPPLFEKGVADVHHGQASLPAVVRG
jgi:predicted small secreted protein